MPPLIILKRWPEVSRIPHEIGESDYRLSLCSIGSQNVF